MQRRPADQPVTAGLVTTAAVCTGTATVTLADDLGEPYAALSIVCVAAVAISAVRRLITRAETAERRAAEAERKLGEERTRRATSEREYQDLVDDFNELAKAEALRVARDEDHGPRCQCRRRGPRPFLTLVNTEGRQGSA